MSALEQGPPPLWLSRQREAQRQAAMVARIARAAEPELSLSRGPKVPAGGDLIRLRGIPAIGRGVSGAMAGSRP